MLPPDRPDPEPSPNVAVIPPLRRTPGLAPRAPASCERASAFEARFGIALPPTYRRFVREVADGLVYEGASWLFSLDEIARDLSDRALPARPFPYRSADGDAIRAAVTAARAAGSVFSREVMSLQRVGDPDGCLTLASNGGNDFSVLVVSGEQAGWMWRTGEIDFPETRALYDPASTDAAPLGFDEWLALWGECFLGLSLELSPP